MRFRYEIRNNRVEREGTDYWLYWHPGEFWVAKGGIWSGDEALEDDGYSVDLNEEDDDEWGLVTINEVVRMAEIFQP